MDGGHESPITFLRQCFPAITMAQVTIAAGELQKYDATVGHAAVVAYVKGESEFVVSRFVSLVRELALRNQPAAPNYIAATLQLEHRLQRAVEAMRKMTDAELEDVKQKALAPIGQPLRARLERLPVFECRFAQRYVADRMFKL